MKSMVTILIVLAVAGAAIIGAILFARSTADLNVQPNVNRGSFVVYFGNSSFNPQAQDCSAVFSVSRTTAGTPTAREAMTALVAGPTTAEQQQGYYSSFSSATAQAVRQVNTRSGVMYIDLQDVRATMPNASASCASAQLMAEIGRTAKQFSGVHDSVVAIEGQPQTFYEWLQMDCPAASNHCDSTPFR